MNIYFTYNFLKSKINLFSRNHISSERSERRSYYQSYMGHLEDIQTALKPLKKIGKIEIIFYDHSRTSCII